MLEYDIKNLIERFVRAFERLVDVIERAEREDK